MDDVFQKIERLKLVPVVTLRRIDGAEEQLAALAAGGLPVAEICFRTGCAEEALRLAVRKFPAMLIGAGTVIGGAQCERAIRAGAEFIVSPGLSEEVAAVCRAQGVLYLPGIVTPTEILHALSLGLTRLKFFPAENFGGLPAIRALSAAFPQVRFMPTGGINPENMNEYLAFPPVFACGGSWMLRETPAQTEEAVRAALGRLGSV